MIVDRYAAVGLRSNPFAAEVGVRYPSQLFADRGLADPPPAGSATLVQVIGDRGAGKTTQLARWRSRDHGPYHYVPNTPYGDRWGRPPVATLVYADEIDRMPTVLRRRWLRALGRLGATLVAGSHADLGGVARRAGLAVVTHRLGPVGVDVLREIVARRVQAVRCVDRPLLLDFDDADIDTLHARANGSIRRFEVLAHEVIAGRVHDPMLRCDTIEPERYPDPRAVAALQDRRSGTVRHP